MILRIFLIASLQLFLFVSGFTFAQDTGPKTVFWKISGNGMEQASWLFGTIHIIPASSFKTFEQVDASLEKSSRLILEMAVDVPMSTQMEWAKKLMLPEGQFISDFVTEQEFNRLKSLAIDSFGIKDLMFNMYTRMKPFAFYSAFIPGVVGEKTESYELYFSKLAKKNKIPVGELESFDFQLSIFDSIPNEKQMEMFFSPEANLKAEMDKLISMYLSQDIYAMANEISSDESYKDFEQQLIILRNKAWVPKIEQFMAEGPCFIAVGAGHLAGEQGLIFLLCQEGYTLEPVLLP